MFELQFPASEVRRWAGEYAYQPGDEVPTEIGHRVKKVGYLTAKDLKGIAHWKSRRSARHCDCNSEAYVREVTGAALNSTEPRFKIESLRILDGVDWPTASVILHFCDVGKWPVMDWRAFWSLGAEPPAGRYSFALWDEYTEACRRIARAGRHSMRTVDRALWTYSKLNQ